MLVRATPGFGYWLIKFDGVAFSGVWDIAPAYDLCHAAGSDFTRFHQLSINGKTSDFTKYAGLPRHRDKATHGETINAFST